MTLLSPQLEAFISVVEHKTVHAAADALHLTQTAVTQRIRALETKLQSTVFIRSRRGMALTPEGESLLRYCQAAIALEGETLAKIHKAGIETTIEITICGPSSLMKTRIIPSCVEVMKEFPNVLLHFDVMDTEERHHKLRSGEVDFAIVHEDDISQEMQFTPLKPEQYVLVCSADWKGRKLRDIIANERIIDFNPNDQFTFQYLKAFELFEHVKHGRHYVNQTDDLAKLVSLGLGYSTLPKEMTKPWVADKKLILLNQGRSLPIHYGIAWYDRPQPPTYFTQLLNFISRSDAY